MKKARTLSQVSDIIEDICTKVNHTLDEQEKRAKKSESKFNDFFRESGFSTFINELCESKNMNPEYIKKICLLKFEGQRYICRIR